MTSGLVSRSRWLGQPWPRAGGFGQSAPRFQSQSASSHSRISAVIQTLAPFFLDPQSPHAPASSIPPPRVTTASALQPRRLLLFRLHHASPSTSPSFSSLSMRPSSTPGSRSGAG
ncbi:hypothetical protein VPH35_036817 [Triticum aestivum]|uniref:Uncharacterized protein n=3 Tax=Aegilops tauschii subsp. strangulata TaxID=200361 RepID=A0A453BGP5_AEGTS